MEITLPPDLLKFIEEKVQAGQFQSPSEVIHGALAVLKEQEEWTSEDIANLREDIAVGLEQLERGEGDSWDVEEAKAKLRERVGRAKRAS
jgi:antitoxin ParD1/3/4